MFQQFNGIEWFGFIKIFQEVVIFIWKLGICYLWIDFFCIVQDDVDDWVREVGKMVSIYENVIFILVVVVLVNSYVGLFCGIGLIIEFNLLLDGGDGFGFCESMCLW